MGGSKKQSTKKVAQPKKRRKLDADCAAHEVSERQFRAATAYDVMYGVVADDPGQTFDEALRCVAAELRKSPQRIQQRARRIERVYHDSREKKFWWEFFQRQEALEKRLRKWQNDGSTDLATREQKDAALQEQLDRMKGLARQDSVDPVPKGLVRLKRWYWRLTPEQRGSWARGDLSDEPEVPAKLLADMQAAYDKLYSPSQRAVAEQLEIDRKSIRFENAWAKLHKK